MIITGMIILKNSNFNLINKAAVCFELKFNSIQAAQIDEPRFSAEAQRERERERLWKIVIG